MRSGVIIGVAVMLLTGIFSCRNSIPKDYSQQEGSWYFNYVILGGAVEISDSNGTRTDMRISSRSNVLFDSIFVFPPGNPIISKHLKHFYVGDSIVFLLPENAEDREQLPVQSDDTLFVSVKILGDESPDMNSENGRPKLKTDELHQMIPYLLQAGVDTSNIPDDIVILWDSAGSGKDLEMTDLITIAYRGYLCDQSLIDDTYDIPEPFSFRPCDPNQVLEGILHGLQGMKEGGKRKIIIPSRLGYGSKGSSTGAIAPNTPLIYTIEIIKIMQK